MNQTTHIDSKTWDDAVESRKPALGIMPRATWVEHRITDLISAMERHDRNGQIPELDWAEELCDHIRNLTEN